MLKRYWSDLTILSTLTLVFWAIGNGYLASPVSAMSAQIGARSCEEALDCISQGKYPVCHRPPGNPENSQELCVGSVQARQAHLEQHELDSLGCCKDVCRYLGDGGVITNNPSGQGELTGSGQPSDNESPTRRPR